MKIHFTTDHQEGFAFVSFQFEGSLEPADLKTLSPPDPIKEGFAQKGVILSGRGPVWLYGFLIHFYHPTRFVAVHDPRLAGAVVVESHHSHWSPGDIIPLMDPS